MKGETFIFFGPAGSGKGTQTKLLQDFLASKGNSKIIPVGTGDEYRRLMTENPYIGGLIKDSMERGELQPDVMTTAMVYNRFFNELDEDAHVFLDGFPRTLNQSKALEEMFRFFKRKDIKIINIVLDAEEAVKRNLLRGRNDDTEEAMKKRMQEYSEKVIPAMTYFQGKNGYEIFNIKGDQTIEEVHQEIINKLNFS